MHAGRLPVKVIVTAGVSAVAVMADVAAAGATNAVTVLKDGQKDVPISELSSEARVGQKPEATNAVNAAPSRAVNNAQTCAQSSARICVSISATSNAAKAKSSASHAHRGNRVKVAARSAHAVNAVSVPSAASSASQWMLLSKTSRWPTRQLWQPPWAVEILAQTWVLTWALVAQMRARTPRAVNAQTGATVDAAMNAVTNHKANHATDHVQSRAQIGRTSMMRLPLSQL